MNQEQAPKIEAEYFRSYEDFSKNIRLWYLTYGVGATVALLSSGSAWATLVEAKCSNYIGFYFLFGIFFQVLGTLLNKYTMMYLAHPELIKDKEPDKYTALKGTYTYKVSDWISEQHWIDLLFDYQTLVFFTKGTILAFQILNEKPGLKICVEQVSLGSILWFVILWVVGSLIILYQLKVVICGSKKVSDKSALDEKSSEKGKGK